MKKENRFQSELVKDLKAMFPGCVVLKNEANGVTPQGFPDLTILYKDRWAVLECKRSEKEAHQPNQDIYVERAEGMSFGSFIYPENKEQVLHAIQRSFED